MGNIARDPAQGGGPALDTDAVAALARHIAAATASAVAACAAEIRARDTVPMPALTARLSAAIPERALHPAPLPAGAPRPPLPDTERLAELGHSRLTTPYRLWSALVEHEVAAFAFWSYASAHATSDGAAAAEALAVTALDRARRWRARRREAYVADAEPRRSDAEWDAERALAEADAARDDTALHEAQAKSEAAIRALKAARAPAP